MRELLSLKARTHLAIIGMLLLLAAGFLAIIAKMNEESARVDASLAYLSSQLAITYQNHNGSNTNTPPLEAESHDGQFSLRVGETWRFDDGSSVTLEKINDSRCKPDVQCIWAGELAAEVRLKTTADDPGEILHLGLMTKPCDKGLTLRSITENSATFFIMMGSCQ